MNGRVKEGPGGDRGRGRRDQFIISPGLERAGTEQHRAGPRWNRALAERLTRACRSRRVKSEVDDDVYT